MDPFRIPLLVSTLGLATIAGCHAASRETADASAQDSSVVDASDEGDAADAADADAAIVYPIFSLDAGSTWTDLYRDYFGGTGVASCAGKGSCHGDTGGQGYNRSGYLCPANDKHACYEGITLSADAGGAGLIEPDASFLDDPISTTLRQEDGGGGEMPLFPEYTFTTVDIERISAWVEAGAPNN